MWGCHFQFSTEWVSQMREKSEFLQYGRAFRDFFHRYINGSKGVISLFLAILMVPFVSIAGVLINAARVNSAIAVFDEALCNASNSTLGTYDKFLKKRFGLLAMSQDVSGGGPGYTAENLLSDTFRFYMEQNLEALSNTYIETDATAAGVYPLTDTDVLLAEVMEYGKYSVPTKMIIDGLSLDSILKDLTKSLNMVDDLFRCASSGTNMVVSFDKMQNKMNELKKALEACVTADGQYRSGYSGFSSAVGAYNDMVAEMEVEVGKCQDKVDAAEAALAVADEDSYGAALADLQAAQKELQNTIDKYHNNLIPLRNTVAAKKTDYVNALTTLSEKVGAAGTAVKEAQDSTNDLLQKGTALTNNVITTVGDGHKKAIDKNTETMKELKESAEKYGKNQAYILYDQQIKENNEAKVEIGNVVTITKETLTNGSAAADKINEFAQESLESRFADLKGKIDDLRDSVSGYVVVQEDEAMADTAAYYRNDLNLPKKPEDVQKLLDDLGNEIQDSSFLAIVKALIGFFEAIFSLDFLFDPKLMANISSSAYSDIGGLPSHKTSTTPEFQAGDKQQSEYYKSIMGDYASSALNTSSVSAFEGTVEAIRADMKTISTAWNEIEWYNVLIKLGTIIGAIISIGGHLLVLVGQILDVLAHAAYAKVLLAGYIGYNVPNRTTYEGSALTGAGYNLPEMSAGYSDKIFCGAETEYIMMGSTSEVVNQTALFFIIYVIRLVWNVPLIVSNAEVREIATAAGSVTLGGGALIAYFLYALVEPLADTLILVNGGDIPIVKTKAYLTPSGIVDLVGTFYHLKLEEDQKETLYQHVVGAMSPTDTDSAFATSYRDFTPDPGSSSFLDSFKFDYTNTLILLMLFFGTEGMLKRLADVIQMESTYNAKINGLGSFNLSNSFTYLRASGSFATNEFIRLSDGDGLNSPVRVVYRGY